MFSFEQVQKDKAGCVYLSKVTIVRYIPALSDTMVANIPDVAIVSCTSNTP